MRKFMKKFLSQDEGSVTVEAVIIIPVVFAVFMIGFTYFDIFRAKALSLKANYAISDMISRNDNVTNADISGYYKLFRYLTNNNDGAWIRVTAVRCKKKCAKPERVLVKTFSKVRPSGKVPSLTTTDIRTKYADAIPKMYKGEYLVIVETNSAYIPIFSGDWTGVFARHMKDLVVTKPRGAGPKICFENEDCNG